MGFSEDLIDKTVDSFSRDCARYDQLVKEGKLLSAGVTKSCAKFKVVAGVAAGIVANPVNGIWHLGKRLKSGIEETRRINASRE